MRRGILLTIWLFTDLAVFTLCYVAAYFLRVGFIFSTDFPFDRFITATIITSPAWLALLIGTRTFSLLRKQFSLRTAAHVAYACVGGAAIFSLTYYFLFGAFFSRGLLLLAFSLSIVATWAWHVIFGFVLRIWMRGSTPDYPTLVVGATREATKLLRSMRENRSPLSPVAILDGKGTKETEIEGVPVLGKLNKLEDTLKRYGVTHVIQCSDMEQSLNLLSACRKHRINYIVLPSVFGIIEGDERVESLEGVQVTVVRPKGSRLQWFFQ